MTDRAARAVAFIARSGWDHASRTVVAGDASNRRYDRLTAPDGETAILMDAPPDKGENVRPFVRIATYLRGLNLSAPAILAEDAQHGFLLLEDLGDALFDRVVAAQPETEEALYASAVDVLIQLHSAAPPPLAAYDGAAMTELALLAFDLYGATATGGTEGRDEAQQTLQTALTPLTPSVLIQRDYHAQNLIWLPGRAGPARVGLLDFQDAMLGHPAYDLCSILMDARRDVPPALRRAMLDRYIAAAGIDDKDAFTAAYHALAAQRNLRILGVFTRLCVRDGKAHYVDLIPRVWGHIEVALAHPSLASLADSIYRQIPAPSPQILERIKAQCATLRTP